MKQIKVLPLSNSPNKQEGYFISFPADKPERDNSRHAWSNQGMLLLNWNVALTDYNLVVCQTF